MLTTYNIFMSWYSYRDVAEQKEAVAWDLARRQKRGERFEVFEAPAGRKLVQTFWGQGWCRHLETYGGYESRLPRGRTYLRSGKVYNLTVAEGLVTAEVLGSSIYQVRVAIAPLSAKAWGGIRERCQGQVGSLLDLLGGKLGDGVMQVVVDPERGLFPGRRDIRHQCSCPDVADLCKHQAAVLYALGGLFDRDPKVFFELRGVDPSELIAASARAVGAAAQAGGGELGGEDLSALFGIDMEDLGEVEAALKPSAEPEVKVARKAAVKAARKAAAKTAVKVAAKTAVKTAAKAAAKTARKAAVKTAVKAVPGARKAAKRGWAEGG